MTAGKLITATRRHSQTSNLSMIVDVVRIDQLLQASPRRKKNIEIGHVTLFPQERVSFCSRKCAGLRRNAHDLSL